MPLVSQPVSQFVDAAGLPYVGAFAYFYDTGTTTLVAIYSDADLTTTQENPVTTDDEGVFPPVYLDSLALYRMKVTNADGSITICDIDPVNEEPYTLTADEIDAALGYTPCDPADTVFTAPATNNFNPTPTAIPANAVGYMGSPINIQDENYTLQITDFGLMLVADDGDDYVWTIPPNSSVPFPVGACFWVSNINTGQISLTPGAGVELFIAGTTSSGVIILQENSFGLVKQIEANVWLLIGSVGEGGTTHRDLNEDYSFALQDAGTLFIHNDTNDYNWTIPSHSDIPFPIGWSVAFFTASTGSGTHQTLVRGSGVTQYRNGIATDQDVVIAECSLTTLTCVSQDVWIASGGSLS